MSQMVLTAHDFDVDLNRAFAPKKAGERGSAVKVVEKAEKRQDPASEGGSARNAVGIGCGLLAGWPRILTALRSCVEAFDGVGGVKGFAHLRGKGRRTELPALGCATNSAR